jgi:hypothetical protein
MDFDVENEYGSLYVEPRGPDRGALFYVEFKNVEGMPPNHIALNETELTHLAKWIVGRLNENR